MNTKKYLGIALFALAALVQPTPAQANQYFDPHQFLDVYAKTQTAFRRPGAQLALQGTAGGKVFSQRSTHELRKSTFQGIASPQEIIFFSESLTNGFFLKANLSYHELFFFLGDSEDSNSSVLLDMPIGYIFTDKDTMRLSTHAALCFPLSNYCSAFGIGGGFDLLYKLAAKNDDALFLQVACDYRHYFTEKASFSFDLTRFEPGNYFIDYSNKSLTTKIINKQIDQLDSIIGLHVKKNNLVFDVGYNLLITMPGDYTMTGTYTIENAVNKEADFSKNHQVSQGGKLDLLSRVYAGVGYIYSKKFFIGLGASLYETPNKHVEKSSLPNIFLKLGTSF